MDATAVIREVLVWVLLYFPPAYGGTNPTEVIRSVLPTYVSVWQDEGACREKARKLNEFMYGSSDPNTLTYGFNCVPEALRDTATEGN